MRTLLAAVLLHLVYSTTAGAAFFRRSHPIFHRSGVTLRKRLNVTDLIADPGTFELDFGSLYSYTTSSFTLPSALRFTPAGDSFFIGRTEYSLSFDSLASVPTDGNRVNFDIAVAPQITALPATTPVSASARPPSPVTTAAATVSVSLPPGPPPPPPLTPIPPASGASAPDTAATSPATALSPASTAHANALLEKSTGFERTVSVFGGLAYQFNPHVSLDVSGQRFSIIGPNPDRQLLSSASPLT